MSEGDVRRKPRAIGNLSIVRACLAQAGHRIRGQEFSGLSDAMYRYFQGIRVSRISLREPLDIALINIHSVFAASRRGFRTGVVSLRGPRAKNDVIRIQVKPAEIAGNIRDIQRSILDSTTLGIRSKLALSYFEILKTHPFEDYNGRTVRTLQVARSWEMLGVSVDITMQMRRSLHMYNANIGEARSPEAYDKWVRYFSGLMDVELWRLEMCWDRIAAGGERGKRAEMLIAEIFDLLKSGSGVTERLSAELNDGDAAYAQMVRDFLT